MTPQRRADLVKSSVKATTAVGMCRAVWREAEIARNRQALRNAGVHITENPDPPVSLEDRDTERAARRQRRALTEVLAEAADRFLGSGNAYTAAELADEILSEAGLSDSVDPEVRSGVRQVCDRIIKGTAPVVIDGTNIPRLITARVGNRFSRVPVMNASLAHFEDMLEMRREQLRQEQAEIDSLAAVYDKLAALADGRADARIGDLLTQSVMTHGPDRDGDGRMEVSHGA